MFLDCLSKFFYITKLGPLFSECLSFIGMSKMTDFLRLSFSEEYVV